MTCTHQSRREIAEPQKNVRYGELFDERLWFCNDCGEKWETSEKLGDVESIDVMDREDTMSDEYFYGLTLCDQKMIEHFHAEREANPDLCPYVGPGETLERFLAGDVVTHQQFVADDSNWVARNILPAQMRRLQYMMDRSTHCGGEVCNCSPWPS